MQEETGNDCLKGKKKLATALVPYLNAKDTSIYQAKSFEAKKLHLQGFQQFAEEINDQCLCQPAKAVHVRTHV